jgi:Fe-S-cluster containining protein
MSDPQNPIDQLCPNCGLCCNGALFADVELRAADDRRQFKKLGLPLVKKGLVKVAFAQPCACFDGKLCQIYAERPRRCRLFACGLLKQVKAGRMQPALALKKITAAKKQIQKVEDLLQGMGQRDRSLPLTHRYSATMSVPLDLADDTRARRYGNLMFEMDRLMVGLQRDFLT